MSKKKNRKDSPSINTVADLHREKVKAKERLSYTEGLVQEDWESLKEQLRPSAILSSTERLIPILSNFLPLSRITSSLAGNFFKGNSDNDKDSTEEDPEQEKASNSWLDRLKKGFYWSMIPFGVGTVATALFLRKRRKS